MSFGKVKEAVRALKAKGLPPNLNPGQLHKRIYDELVALGYDPRTELPSRRSLDRYLKRLLEADATCAICPTCASTNGAVIGILAADNSEPPPTNDEDEMRVSNHQSMQSITGCFNTWSQEVPFDHGVDEVLAPGYLHGNYLKFRQGDRVELQPADFSWMVAFLVVSVNRHARTVNTRLTMPPTFLLGSLDRSSGYLTDQFQKAEQDFQAARISRTEFEERHAVLKSLRDDGRWPSAWLAALLQQLNRAYDAGLLSRLQHGNAAQELFSVMDEEQSLEVSAIINGNKVDLSPAASATLVREALEKAKPPAEFGQLKVVDTPPEIREKKKPR